MDILGQFSNFLFGLECLGCGRASENRDPWLCPECRLELERESRASSFPNEDCMCLYPMKPLTRRLVHALKYRGITGMASYLVGKSSVVGDGVVAQNLSLHARPFFFVPVPLHGSRLRERGYNQAERIASGLASVTGGRVVRWLTRNSFRESQTKLSREEREWNVAGAFSARLPKEMPARGTVFIVDDVYTTGATTGACRFAFGKAFPLDVKVMTLLYEESATGATDYACDRRMDWEYG